VITKIGCQLRALELRVAAYDLMDRRDAMMAVFGDQLKDQYPGWVRNFDKQIGDRLAEAKHLIKLAQGPAWRRWLS